MGKRVAKSDRAFYLWLKIGPKIREQKLFIKFD